MTAPTDQLVSTGAPGAGVVDLTAGAWSQWAACDPRSAAYDPAAASVDWFPERHAGASNHGLGAKAVCAGCPAREECLVDAVARNEQWGIRGGAGGGIRRWLRRAWVADGPGGPVWLGAVAQHWLELDGEEVVRPDRNGAGATHGCAATYARGCDCDACALAVACRGARRSVSGARRRSGRQVAA